MYKISRTTDPYRENPWEIPYEDRIKRLITGKRAGKKTVAYLYPVFDSSTFRYRGYNMAQALDYSLNWCGSWFQYADRKQLSGALSAIDVLVLIRCCMDAQMGEFLEHVRRNGITMCYDIDDLIYMPKYIEEMHRALNLKEESEWNYWYGLTQRNYEVAKQCDAFLTTNEHLSGLLRADFQKTCYTMHNFLNRHQETVSEEYFKAKMNARTQRPFEIGYFSGSPTHEKDVELILPEIAKFLKKHSDASFKIVGHLNLPERYRELAADNRIQFVPFQSFVDLQYEQAKVDVNVVPLVQGDFTDCKSELKYFESAIVGTVTCASPSFAYSQAIKNGYNGYLCRKGEWLKTLEKIYEKRNDHKRMETIRDSALREYSEENQVQRLESLLEKIVCSGEKIPDDRINQQEVAFQKNYADEVKKRKQMEDFYYLYQDMRKERELLQIEKRQMYDTMEILRSSSRNYLFKHVASISLVGFLKEKVLWGIGNLRLMRKKKEFWKPVFDADYYASNNPDVRYVYGQSDRKLLRHFIRKGMMEGRKGNSCFDVNIYMAHNPDIVDLLKYDIRAYYLHYLSEGLKDGRRSI